MPRSSRSPLVRLTKQRRAFDRVLFSAGRPLGVGEITEAMQKIVPSVGQSTVYRLIAQQLRSGAIRAVTIPNTPDRYEVDDQRHHHHFYCSRCGKVYELTGCPGPLTHLAPQGCQVERHEVTLIGSCAKCS